MEKATPRQIAYLKFTGYSDADSYTKEQAGLLIEKLGNQDNYKTFEEFAGVQERIARWTKQGFMIITICIHLGGKKKLNSQLKSFGVLSEAVLLAHPNV